MTYYTDNSRTTFNDMTGLPVKSVRVNEGNVTRLDVVEPTGGTTNVLTYQNPLQKGDLVVIDSKSITNNVIIKLRDPILYPSAVGITVSSPRGTDTNTDTGSLPAINDMRVVDIAFFGQGIIEFVANTDISAGDEVIFSQIKGFENYIEKADSEEGHDGAMIALTAATAGEHCPILMASYGYNELKTPTSLQSKSNKKGKED